MIKDSIPILICRFAFPSMVGIMVAGVQSIIDGLFIGNSVGSLGLAGVTLAYPFVLFIIATGVMIGVGSASLIALELGRARRENARDLMAVVFPLICIASLLISFGGLTAGNFLIRFIGAGEMVCAMATEYMDIIFIGSIFIILSMALDPLVRNDGHPLFAMATMVLAVLVNLVLDYIFIMKMDMQLFGAALATVFSFAISATLLSLHFFGNRTGLKLRLRDMNFHFAKIKKIVKNGLPSLVMQLSVSIVFLSHNIVLLHYGNDGTVAAYGIITYFLSIFYMLFEGIAMGVQPIIGYNYGAGYFDRVHEALKLAMIACVVIGSIGILIAWTCPEKVASMFDPDTKEVLENTIIGMKIIATSLFIQGIVIVNAIYYQSIAKTGYALFIHLGRIFMFLLPLLILFPTIFDIYGIWFATPVADLLSFILVMVLLRREVRQLKANRTIVNKNSSCEQ